MNRYRFVLNAVRDLLIITTFTIVIVGAPLWIVLAMWPRN